MGPITSSMTAAPRMMRASRLRDAPRSEGPRGDADAGGAERGPEKRVDNTVRRRGAHAPAAHRGQTASRPRASRPQMRTRRPATSARIGTRARLRKAESARRCRRGSRLWDRCRASRTRRGRRCREQCPATSSPSTAGCPNRRPTHPSTSRQEQSRQGEDNGRDRVGVSGLCGRDGNSEEKEAKQPDLHESAGRLSVHGRSRPLGSTAALNVEPST